MYAIRSYYVAYCFADVGSAPEAFMKEHEQALTRLLAGEPADYPIHESQVRKSRITSYNVCYTKLLRRCGRVVKRAALPPCGISWAGR